MNGHGHGHHGSSNGHNLPSSNINNFHDAQPNFKREFEANMGLVPSSTNLNRPAIQRPPLRPNSSSSFGMQQQIPRSIPEYHPLHRANSNELGMMNRDHNGAGDMSFRWNPGKKSERYQHYWRHAGWLHFCKLLFLIFGHFDNPHGYFSIGRGLQTPKHWHRTSGQSHLITYVSLYHRAQHESRDHG